MPFSQSDMRKHKTWKPCKHPTFSTYTVIHAYPPKKSILIEFHVLKIISIFFLVSMVSQKTVNPKYPIS